jgi:hypothetical protein
MYFSLRIPQKKSYHEDGILKKLSTLLLCFLVGFSLTACGGSGGSGGSTGTLSTSLTDSSTDMYQAVYVTIARVEVHHNGDGSWETVAEPNKTYNLLDLVNGVRETLGIATLATGHYTQMRLIIGETAEENGLNILSMPHGDLANYIIDMDDEIHEMKVSSGTNTGLKIVNGFDINENQTTELILDFDAMSSVVIAGSSGKYLLKPTVKVINTANYAIVYGTATNTDTTSPIPLEGVFVSAQTADSETSDEKDQVVIEAGTLTVGNGEYALFLAPGGYNLVATKAGHLTDCTVVTLEADSTTTVDFTLADATTGSGTLSGLITISTPANDDQYVTIDFRQETTCFEAQNAMISVMSVNVADGGVYSVDLPAGDYQVVASTFNETTQIDNVTVISSTETQLDITF